MGASHRRRHRGQGMVEFSLVGPLLLLVIIGLVDFARAVQANSTVAEAARQGARQAIADALASDSPFSAYNNRPCSGQVFTTNQTGTGCLTDARIFQTVTSVLGGFSQGTTLTTAPPSACPNPAVGRASVCVYPSEAGAAARGLARQ